jgi:23S rRNA (pseudouridine1915-N3)-methyltransferase
MLIRLIAAGTRLPQWVNEGFAEYAGRLQGDYRLELREIALAQRNAGSVQQALAREGQRMIAALPTSCCVTALQVTGRAMSTEQLAQFLQARAGEGRPLALCIGGPDGLAAELDERADHRWSLSAMTLPHGLARVVVAEALYRAVSVLKGHPYHRA